MTGIYEHVLKSVRKGVAGLPPDGLAYPGAPAEAGASPFAPGARDHLALYRGEVKPRSDEESLAAIEAAAREAAATREPSDESIAKLESAIDVDDTLAVVDAALDRVGALGLEDWEPLYDALSTVALHTSKPQALKLSMALLGQFQEPETIPFYRAMARHPEFSLYATTALANDPSPEARVALVQLLDETTGWAKVDVVERLLRVEEEDFDVGEVLLTKGMDGVEPVGSFIALGLAERCDLAGALEARGLTRDTLSGCCHVLAELARAPGGWSLSDYEEKERALEAFLDRLPAGPADLDMAEAAEGLAGWAERERREDAIEAARAYLERPDVVGAIVDELLHKNPDRRAQAARIAGRAKMTDALSTLLDVWKRHPDEDEPVIAALRIAEGRELEALRDRMLAKIEPAKRAGDKLAEPRLDAGAKWRWQYLALLESLPKIPDDASRAALRAALADRDPDVRRAAAQALASIDVKDPALATLKDDPAPGVRIVPPPREPAPAKKPPAKPAAKKGKKTGKKKRT